jgi:hypothetical protein
MHHQDDATITSLSEEVLELVLVPVLYIRDAKTVTNPNNPITTVLSSPASQQHSFALPHPPHPATELLTSPPKTGTI